MNILLCTDGSDMSEKATKKTADIASLVKDVEVTVIYVHQPMPYGAGYAPIEIPKHLNEELKLEGKKILEKAAKSLEGFGIEHQTYMLEGHPARTIIDYAANHSVDLLVIGNRGSGGLKRVLMGSVSSVVVQEVQCDVLVVK